MAGTTMETDVWALPARVTEGDVRELAAAARTTRRCLRMHARTAALCAAAFSFGPIATSIDLLERTLGVPVVLDIMYPDGVVAAVPA